MSQQRLCECGCGNPTGISRQTDSEYGYAKGQPRRYLRGHHIRHAARLAREAPSEPPPDRFCERGCGQLTPIAERTISRRRWVKGERRPFVPGHYSSREGIAKTHGMTGTRTYRIWAGVLRRCSNPKEQHWHRYGGRGIKVCERWKKFENFLADMGECPDGKSIDRIDNDGHYEPGNCRWASHRQQSLNTSQNTHITVFGVTKTLTEWSEETGIKRDTIRARLKKGWTPERALAVQP